MLSGNFWAKLRLDPRFRKVLAIKKVALFQKFDPSGDLASNLSCRGPILGRSQVHSTRDPGAKFNRFKPSEPPNQPYLMRECTRLMCS
jgi:hypothetical protein